jgi:hypothetical protein
MPANPASSVSDLIEAAFNSARSVRPDLDKAWVALSMKVVSGVTSASSNIQRAGSLDLLLRCMEDELVPRMSVDASSPDFAFHYQKMFSEIWVGLSYEILRAARQRAREAVQQEDSKLFNPSISQKASGLLVDLERLRMPFDKYEIAKDYAIHEPIPFVPIGNGPTDAVFYNPKDPRRNHIVPSGLSARGSVMWLALDIEAKREYWLERRDLADRFLDLV